MAKKGRNRRTKEERLAARDRRDSQGYFQNLAKRVALEQAEQVSETEAEK